MEITLKNILKTQILFIINPMWFLIIKLLFFLYYLICSINKIIKIQNLDLCYEKNNLYLLAT
jgi:hypothetical protein